AGADAECADRLMALRRHLIILAALTILPLLGFTTWIVLEVHREDRARAERALTETARALSLAVEREVTSMASALESLATSKALDAGDLKAFYEQAAALRAMQQEWTTLVLTDSAGATLLDLRRPFGTRLPDLRAEIGDVAQVVAARRPSIGESFGGEGGTRLFAIRSPATGLTVALGAPADTIDSPLRRSLWRIAGAGALMLVLGVGLAVAFAQRLTRPITGLARAARDVGHGTDPPPVITSITEVND